LVTLVGFGNTVSLPPVTDWKRLLATSVEGTSDTHTLVANDTTAIFNIIENTSNLFSLNGSTLSFDGAATDLESNVNLEKITCIIFQGKSKGIRGVGVYCTEVAR
jgi:hypothetical protein